MVDCCHTCNILCVNCSVMRMQNKIPTADISCVQERGRAQPRIGHLMPQRQLNPGLPRTPQYWHESMLKNPYRGWFTGKRPRRAPDQPTASAIPVSARLGMNFCKTSTDNACMAVFCSLVRTAQCPLLDLVQLNCKLHANSSSRRFILAPRKASAVFVLNLRLYCCRPHTTEPTRLRPLRQQTILLLLLFSAAV